MSDPAGLLYLQQEDVKACGGLDMAAALDAVERAFRLYDRNEVIERHIPAIHWGTGPGVASPCTLRTSAATSGPPG